MVSIDKIKQLREETQISITECKKVLEESGGDIEKAKEILRKSGEKLAQKKSDRETASGIVSTYIHGEGTVGVMVQINCETDFVARSDDFKELGHQICLQIAAMNPLFVSEEDVSEEIIEKEKEVAREQFKDSGKPENIIENIIEGKIKKFVEEKCLLNQAWVKDPEKKVKDLITEYVAKLGENIAIKRFVRYEL